jgi:predicted transcriptional regulator
MKRKTGTFGEFKEFTLALARGERKLDPSEPKVWFEPVEGLETSEGEVQFASFEAGATLLSAKNRALLRTIATRRPQSVAELAEITGRPEQSLLRTLKRLESAGIVRFDRGEGGAHRPVLAARRVRFDIDLLAPI